MVYLPQNSFVPPGEDYAILNSLLKSNERWNSFVPPSGKSKLELYLSKNAEEGLLDMLFILDVIVAPLSEVYSPKVAFGIYDNFLKSYLKKLEKNKR